MERRLSEAAFRGDLIDLHKIVEEDPLILDRITASCVDETPLHAAAVLGHLSFVKELLNRKPELAAESDSRGCSPLHLAAAKGHADVVKELLLVNSDVASLRNLDGRTALHVAAVKGREGVLTELLGLAPGLTRVLTDRSETALHLCVKWNRYEAVKLLSEEMRKGSDESDADDSSLNWKDCIGNTALHIAVAEKHFEIIKFLLEQKEVEVNALNKNRLTALDLLRQSPRDKRDMEIEEALLSSGASSAKDLHLITDEQVEGKAQGRLSSQQSRAAVERKPTDWLGRRRSALMVVASLIATVAFQAGLTPPGGVWEDDYFVDENGQNVSDPHSAGHSVMAYQEPRVYGAFMIFNTIAFLASLSIILLLVSGLPLNQRKWMWLQMVIMWVAISAQVATYFVTLRHMSPGDMAGTLREVTEISVLTWLTLIAVVFIGNVVRLNLWVLRKYGLIKGEERRGDSQDIQEDVFE
ncbi:ankyrin repeat-containing protein BDA1-like [Salvia miltiorrhiza]|uniref:ankyrin repeat-containing protein BDA1-like n=1 Tax=Salvia miltiorrhiza TaxID=226208 RepID=UPI0025AD2DE5|nr:ankyrin repeat-containing protein BDA1-like [Salvia miltiorrhiza]